jgi:hypothetical protein
VRIVRISGGSPGHESISICVPSRFAAALQAITEDQRQTSEIITKGYDEISCKRKNSILELVALP